VSSVPPALAGAVRALAALHERAAAAAAGAPGKKRETDDNARRLGALFWRLNAGQVTPGVASALASLGAALDAGDGGRAAALAAALAESDWDECGAWLTALKRLVKGAGR
jgi:protein transport protein SEC31